METVLILLLLAGVSHAFFPVADTKCNATQNASLCTVTLGGSVYIQLMTNASGHMLQCKKQLSTGLMNVFSLKKGRVTIQEPFRNRTQFFINNGTLKITNVERNDSAQYTVDVFYANGVLLRNITVKLDVQENNLHVWILVCCAVFAVLIVLCCCCCWKKKCQKKSGI